jgi:predicted ATP-grasp superfamily ATP-dependent carboligase
MTGPGSASPDVRPQVPVLVLGKGITALGVLRVLGRRGVPLYVAGEADDLVTGSRWYRPLGGDSWAQGSESDLSRRLEALEIDRMVLLPCSDVWVMAVSRLEPRLRERFPASVAAPDTLRRLVDKGEFAETLQEMGLPHPCTFLLRDAGALASVSEEAFRTSFLKPANSGRFAGEYGVKAIRPGSREQAAALLAEARAKGLELMLQEFIPGPPTRHYFLDGFVDRHGRVCAMFARRRLRMFPPEFGNSSCTESIPLSEVRGAEETLCRLLAGIRYRGVFSAEFKLDERDGLFKILEVNARPWWFVDFAAACGVDVCDMALRDALGQSVEPVSAYRIGRRCIHARRDVASWRAQPRHSRPGLGSLLRSWIGAQQLTFSKDDLRPGWRELAGWIRSKLRRRFGR